MTKIVFVIDSLCAGGAQRQMILLAVLLKQHGVQVEILTYFQSDFFNDILNENGIQHRFIHSTSKFNRVVAMRRAIRSSCPNFVISFLHTPNLIAELSGLPFHNFKIIASERSNDFGRLDRKKIIRYLFHLFSDAVVCNSKAQHKYLTKKVPILKSKLKLIQNSVDLDSFKPVKNSPKGASVSILTIGRYHLHKNYIVMVDAIKIFNRLKPKNDFKFKWYGDNFYQDMKPTNASKHFLQIEEAVLNSALKGQILLHGPERNVTKLYHDATAFCLASSYEGFSNVISEAMACGLPIIASRVGDNEDLVADGVNGFLFEPDSPRSMAEALVRFEELGAAGRIIMGRASYQRAKDMLSQEQLLDKYLELFAELSRT